MGDARRTEARSTRSRRDTVLLWIGATALGLAVLAVAWIIVTGLLARARLDDAKAEIGALRDAVAKGDVRQAQAIGQRIADRTSSAHALTSGPAWWVAANVPVLGSPLRASRVMAGEVDRIGRSALPGVLEVAGDVRQAGRPEGGRVDVDRVAAAAPALHTAVTTTGAALTRIRNLDPSWLPQVAAARRSVLTDLADLQVQLSRADRAVRVAVPLLGAQRPQRIFIGFLNEAEARGLGGIPGQFAVATTDHGHIRFERFGADDDLAGVRAEVSMPTDFTAAFGQDDPTGVFVNSTVSPDFRDAARIWAATWQKKTGERIDAALAVDPTALGYLLDVTGPAELPGGETITGADVAALTQKKVYARFADKPARKAYLSAVAQAASEQLLAGGDPARLLRAAARAAGERRILLWAADPAVEQVLLSSGYGGAMPGTARPAAGFVVTNASGGKLDYYFDRTMTYERSGCGASAAVTASFQLTNNAPASLPRYVTIRADAHAAAAKPGDELLLVTYYGSAGARVDRASVDGRPVATTRGTLRGLTTVSIALEVPRGATRTVTLHLTEPARSGPVQVLRQPLVRPMTVRTQESACP
jgi:hypothetical protein